MSIITNCISQTLKIFYKKPTHKNTIKAIKNSVPQKTLKLSNEKISKLKANWAHTKINSENLAPIVLSQREYKFFSEEIKNVELKKLINGLREILPIKDKNGCSLFIKEVGHKRTYNTRALLKTKFENPQHYEELLTLLNLHEDGVIKYIPRFIMPEGRLNPLVKEDLECILAGKNYFEEFETTTSKAKILSATNIGDAFSIGEQMYVRTAKSFEKLKMDKITYKILFPPIDRYAIAQGFSQNCGPISLINNLIQIPENRIKMYKLFEQKNDTIIVHTLGNIFKRSTFNLYNLEELDDKILSETCYGLKMLEKHSNKDVDIYRKGIPSPKENDKYFCKALIRKTGNPFITKSKFEDILFLGYTKEIEKVKQQLQSVGHTTTLVTGGRGSYELGTGCYHYISVHNYKDGLVTFSNPQGTAEYRTMPIDTFIEKVYGASFYHKI